MPSPSRPKPPVPADAQAAGTPGASAQGAAKGRKRVQMADLARMAGVSTATVSRALSGSTLIPEATRVRITELARSLNYRVNVGAANLRRQDVQTVGVAILGDSMQAISDPFLLSILGTVADALDARGMNLLLTRLKEGQQNRLTDLVDSGQVCGVIVIGQLTWHAHLNQLAAQGLPMVVWGACLPDAIYPVVGGDNEQGGYLATRHLIAQGSRSIAFFGDIHHPEAGLRHRGYLRAMAEAGIASDPSLQQDFLFADVRIRQTIDHWLDRDLPFDAVFASSDVAAMSIIGALKERGIEVPNQVRVVGYDNIALAEHLHPSLSSVNQPPVEAGLALVELLFEAVARQPRRALMLPARLVERESSR